VPRQRSTNIVSAFVLSLVVAVSLLVVWVVYVVRSVTRVREIAGRVGVVDPRAHWVILAIGCILFFVLIVGITYQLGQALAAGRYSRRQEEFVANVTHELKSPLAAIKLHAQTLHEVDLSPEETRRSLESILAQAERMGRLIDDVLESGRITLGRHRPRLEPLELRPVVERYLEGHRSRIESQGVKLEERIDTSAVVLGTSEAVERILNNLLENAARFSSRGGEIRLHVTDMGEEVQIEVADDGIGIPKKELGKIFDRFYQIGKELGGRRGGTGLGLSIVSGLVRDLGGTVRAFSQESRPGARFVVSLPVAERT
jgi:two-component system phosphate regulon sensor histidine kinase PhoR